LLEEAPALFVVLAVEAPASRAPVTEAGSGQRGEVGQIVVRELAETVGMKSDQRSLGEMFPRALALINKIRPYGGIVDPVWTPDESHGNPRCNSRRRC